MHAPFCLNEAPPKPQALPKPGKLRAFIDGAHSSQESRQQQQQAAAAPRPAVGGNQPDAKPERIQGKFDYKIIKLEKIKRMCQEKG